VVSAPRLLLFARIGKTDEPVRVHALSPNAAVERLREGIVHRLSRPGEVERHALRLRSQIEITGDELRAQVDPDCFRIADRRADPFERPHDVLAAIAHPRVERRRESADLFAESGAHSGEQVRIQDVEV